MIKWNAEGLIVDFKVMVRPHKAIEVLRKRMASELAASAKLWYLCLCQSFSFSHLLLFQVLLLDVTRRCPFVWMIWEDMSSFPLRLLQTLILLVILCKIESINIAILARWHWEAPQWCWENVIVSGSVEGPYRYYPRPSSKMSWIGRGEIHWCGGLLFLWDSQRLLQRQFSTEIIIIIKVAGSKQRE